MGRVGFSVKSFLFYEKSAKIKKIAHFNSLKLLAFGSISVSVVELSCLLKLKF